MAQHRDSLAQPQVLFCPFCREGFENERECPDHDLLLVPLDSLPPPPGRELSRASFFLDPRLGRGPVLAGAITVLASFAAPFVRSGSLVASALEVAIDGASNLWLTAGAALGVLAILWRRRSTGGMRAVRVAVLGLAVGGVLPVLYTARRIELMAAARTTEVQWEWGVWLLLTGLVAIAVGSGFLGRKPKPRRG
jgi:hypothetical protein